MSEQNPALHSLKVSFTNASAQLGDLEYTFMIRREQLLAQMRTIMQQAATLQSAAEVQKKASDDVAAQASS